MEITILFAHEKAIVKKVTISPTYIQSLQYQPKILTASTCCYRIKNNKDRYLLLFFLIELKNSYNLEIYYLDLFKLRLKKKKNPLESSNKQKITNKSINHSF